MRLKAFMLDSWIEELKPSTGKHVRRKLENELKDTLHIIQRESNKIVAYPDNLTRDELAPFCFNLEKEVTLLTHWPREVDVTKVAHMVTKVCQSVKDHLVTSKNGLQMSKVFREVALKVLRLLTHSWTIYLVPVIHPSQTGWHGSSTLLPKT